MYVIPVDISQAIAGQDLARRSPSSIGFLRSGQALRQLFRVELLPAAHILGLIPQDAASAHYQYGKLKLLRSFTRLIITVFRITPVHLFNRDQREAAEI